MKKIKEFEDQKLSLSSLKSIVGGESCCTHIEDTSEGTCWDELRETYYDDGRQEIALIVRQAEQTSSINY